MKDAFKSAAHTANCLSAKAYTPPPVESAKPLEGVDTGIEGNTQEPLG